MMVNVLHIVVLAFIETSLWPIHLTWLGSSHSLFIVQGRWRLTLKL
jgi:hypothetical protein